MKAALIIGIFFLLILIWTALHDIIKGGESLTNEYVVFIISAVLLPYLVYTLVRKIKGVHK